MPSGTEFIKHEFDEAIAIQQSIIASGKALSTSHPVAAVKRQLTADLKVDQRHLEQLQKFGKPYGATGKREEVAEALGSLAMRRHRKLAKKRAKPMRRMLSCSTSSGSSRTLPMPWSRSRAIARRATSATRR